MICVRIALLLLAGAAVAQAGEPTLTVYSHRHYETDRRLFDRFTERTGIDVAVVKAGADELIQRLKAEGPNTPADVLITADAGRLVRAENAGLLAPVASAFLEKRVPARLRDPEGHWFGFTKRARVIVYAKDRVDPSELSTYEALAKPPWRSRVLVRSSSNIYNQSLLASLIAAHGEATALEWARGVRRNMARPPRGSDRDQIRGVAAGLGDVAIVNTYYVGLMAESSSAGDREAAEAVSLFFPNQDGRGTHVNVSGAGVVRASAHKAAAKRFLEFLASDEAQATFPRATYEYPVVESVEWSERQKRWGEFKEDPLNLSVLGELNEEAVRIFNRAGWP